jgi:hypothetical protein
MKPVSRLKKDFIFFATSKAVRFLKADTSILPLDYEVRRSRRSMCKTDYRLSRPSTYEIRQTGKGVKAENGDWLADDSPLWLGDGNIGPVRAAVLQTRSIDAQALL